MRPIERWRNTSQHYSTIFCHCEHFPEPSIGSVSQVGSTREKHLEPRRRPEVRNFTRMARLFECGRGPSEASSTVQIAPEMSPELRDKRKQVLSISTVVLLSHTGAQPRRPYLRLPDQVDESGAKILEFDLIVEDELWRSRRVPTENSCFVSSRAHDQEKDCVQTPTKQSAVPQRDLDCGPSTCRWPPRPSAWTIRNLPMLVSFPTRSTLKDDYSELQCQNCPPRGWVPCRSAPLLR